MYERVSKHSSLVSERDKFERLFLKYVLESQYREAVSGCKISALGVKFQVRVFLFDRLRAIFLSNVNFAPPPNLTWQTKFGTFRKIRFLRKIVIFF